ncbi:MAG: ABC transporter permease subunit, partial [Bacteroidota bacterium]
MLAFVLKRGIWFLPTLFIITIVAFGLSKMAPGDPVYLYMEGSSGNLPDNPKVRKRMYIETKKKLGLDYPAFYCSFQAKAYPDTLYRLLTQDERTTARMLIAQYGDWPSIQTYLQELKKLHEVSIALPDSIGRDALFSIRSRLAGLQTQTDTTLIRKRLNLHNQAIEENSFTSYFSPQQERTENAYQLMLKNANRRALYIPKFSWHGTQNQYHLWLSSLGSGDFGYSYRDGLPAGFKIRNALRWTIIMNIIALLLSYGLSIFLGVFMAVRKGRRADRWTIFALFLLYSLPSFWLATMFLLVFGTPDYGVQLFSILELTNLSASASFSERFWTTARYMILPVFCLSYSSI